MPNYSSIWKLSLSYKIIHVHLYRENEQKRTWNGHDPLALVLLPSVKLQVIHKLTLVKWINCSEKIKTLLLMLHGSREMLNKLISWVEQIFFYKRMSENYDVSARIIFNLLLLTTHYKSHNKLMITLDVSLHVKHQVLYLVTKLCAC